MCFVHTGIDFHLVDGFVDVEVVGEIVEVVQVYIEKVHPHQQAVSIGVHWNRFVGSGIIQFETCTANGSSQRIDGSHFGRKRSCENSGVR